MPPTPPHRSLSRKRTLAYVAGALLGLFLALLGTLLAVAWTPLGTTASGDRLTRMRQSPQFKGGIFQDILPRIEPELSKVLPKWFGERHPYRRPKGGLLHRSANKEDFSVPPSSGLRITWLGHSTLIVEIAGKRLLLDPVWSDYVAPLDLEAAKRFIPPPLPFEDLPKLDAVVISHDHYDHLDYPTVVRLAKLNVDFYVPLGVGAHLEYWGVAPTRIHEHDWWEESNLSAELKIVCTPARHFSGRALYDRDATLWAGWAFVSPSARVYFSGDTALFPGFKEIGDRYGPFDATLIENGAYNQLWSDVHLGPEQAVAAHKMLGGGLLIPIHWGMFDLGLHGWTEPMERILVAAEKEGVRVTTLQPGQSVEPNAPPPLEHWWPQRPFETAEQAPIVSSGL